MTGSITSTGSLSRAAKTTATDQQAPRVVAVTVDPNTGDRSRVRATPAAAGVSHATPSHPGPGRARPASTVSGNDVASTPAVRSSSRRTAEYGVTVTSSWQGSASPPKEAATP